MRGSDLYLLFPIYGAIDIMTKLLDIMLFMRSWHLVSSTKIAWIIQGKTFKQNNVQPDLLLEFGLIVSFQPERWKKGTCPCVPLALVAAPSCHNVWCCKPCLWSDALPRLLWAVRLPTHKVEVALSLEWCCATILFTALRQTKIGPPTHTERSAWECF